MRKERQLRIDFWEMRLEFTQASMASVNVKMVDHIIITAGLL